MRCFFLLVLYFLTSSAVWGQKMLLIEKANRAKTTKLYIGESLRFRLSGEENYWYNRTITDILPESNTLLLDNFAVKLDSIAVIKVSRKRIWRITGSTLFAFGASLALATTVGKVLYNDKSVDAIPLYSVSALSLGTGCGS